MGFSFLTGQDREEEPAELSQKPSAAWPRSYIHEELKDISLKHLALVHVLVYIIITYSCENHDVTARTKSILFNATIFFRGSQKVNKLMHVLLPLLHHTPQMSGSRSVLDARPQVHNVMA